MEAVYYAARGKLCWLLRLYPDWTQAELAAACGMSLGWVKKWKQRLWAADPQDERVLHSRSRARIHPPERLDERVVQRILAMRDQPPEEECLQVDRPHTLAEVVQVTAAFQQHYNYERPNQALSCGNRPPRTAFPTLPTLPSVPDLVDPDGWLQAVDGWHVVCTVNARGLGSRDLHSYYISHALAGQAVVLRLDAAEQALLVLRHEQLLKVLPLKGLHHRLYSFDDYVQQMTDGARAQQRLLSWQQRRRLASSDSP